MESAKYGCVVLGRLTRIRSAGPSDGTAPWTCNCNSPKDSKANGTIELTIWDLDGRAFVCTVEAEEKV